MFMFMFMFMFTFSAHKISQKRSHSWSQSPCFDGLRDVHGD
jgi:hypothetical protein